MLMDEALICLRERSNGKRLRAVLQKRQRELSAFIRLPARFRA